MIVATLVNDDRSMMRWDDTILQRSGPSLPDFGPLDWEGEPPTSEEWRWITDNWKLLVRASRRYGGRFHSTGAIVSLLPFVVKSLRSWQEGGGSNRGSYVWRRIGMVWKPNSLPRRFYFFRKTWKGRASRQPKNPVLFGLRSPVPIQEEDRPSHDPETARKAWQMFLALKERDREILEARLGLDGRSPKRQEEIAQVYGISRERIRQVIERVLEDMRESLGIRTPVARTQTVRQWREVSLDRRDAVG